MSIKIDMKTRNKKQLAALLMDIAALIEVTSNKTVTLVMDLTFNKKEDES